jgi:large repetitive protein
MGRLGVASLAVGLTSASLVLLPALGASAQDVCSGAACATPSITTTAGSSSVVLSSAAATLTDTATLTGGSAETGTITFTLVYGGATVDTETAAVSGDGTYQTPAGYTLPTTDTVTGAYQWNVSYSGDSGNAATADQNDPAGQVTVVAASPLISSQPSPASLGLSSTASTLQDTATLAGAYNPTGTITFTLAYGGTTVDTETATVSGDGTYSTPTGYPLPTTPGGTGTYQWSETYSGDANNNSAADVNDGAEDVSPVCASSADGGSCAFGYTGGPVAWTVPAGVTAVTMVADGAQGGAGADGDGGLGGQATADVPVIPGEVLQVDVGGAGSDSTSGGAGGWNGGGASGGKLAGGGGGGSDIRAGACTSTLTCDMTKAVVAAGGGGGGGWYILGGGTSFPGGTGGGTAGGVGTYGGAGGTQTAGGAGGTGAFCANGAAGSLGAGGAGGPDDFGAACDGGGGGGGGYYGGGGAGATQANAFAGGGGSGFGPADVSFADGVRPGDGAISISWPVTTAAPAITSASSAQFPTGQAGSFTVTTNSIAWPLPALTETGTLPTGVTFSDNGDGTATLAGTPGGADAGTYQFQITAANGISPDATQQFTLTVGAAPQITSADSTEFDLGSSGSFTVTTTGDPVPATVTETGALPSGVTFTDNGDGTATIAGTPNEDNGPVEGSYQITLTASQAGGSWPAATQAVTLTVGGNYQYAGFTVNATGTDGMALNPGMGLAVNGSACYNVLSGTIYLIDCGGPGNFFVNELVGSGRTCTSDDLPLQTTAATENCWQRYLAWDPADTVTLSTPASTTNGSTTYNFDHWDTSGQAVPCTGGNTATSCTFQDPSSGVSLTAIYDPATACPAGSYSSTGLQPCTLAPAGSYDAGTGNLGPNPCAAGSFSANPGAAACTPAPAGSYASGTGDTASSLCLAGSYSANAGSASCTETPAGSYDAGTGNTAATPCPAGTTSAAGATACTVTTVAVGYSGPTQVAVPASFAPAATLSSSAAACVSGQTVSFSLSADPLTGAAGTYNLGSGKASSAGAVTGPSVSTAGWENGVYTLTATYAGATAGAVTCPPATTSASLAVTVSGQVAYGAGVYTVPGAGPTSFAFVVALKPHTTSTYVGQIAVVVPGKWLYQASITSYGLTSSTKGLLGGSGSLYWWNTTLNHGLGGWQLAKSGVTFTATATASTKSAAASFGLAINYAPVPPQPATLPNSGSLTISKGAIVLA